MKIKLMLFTLGAVFVLAGFKSKGIYTIYIKEYNVYFSPVKGCNTQYEIKANDSIFLKLKLYDCRGEMTVEAFKNNILVEKGKYKNSLALLRSYGIGRQGGLRFPEKVSDKIIVNEFYQPLRDGIWLFYRTDSVEKRVYKLGIY